MRHTRGTLDVTLYDELNDKDFVVTVSYDYYHGCPGSRDKWGAPLEPDDEPELEIVQCLHSEDECECWDDLDDIQKEKVERKVYEDIAEY